MKAVLPENEPHRLHALDQYRILDTSPDDAFDHIAEMAATFFRVPIAIISLVDRNRIWFKSHHGIDANQVERDAGLCASAILSPEVYYLRDAVLDPCAIDNPLVTGSLGLRFYAAAPLRTHDGFNLGTLCVVDCKPRELMPGEAETLARLTAMVVDEMEVRLATSKVAELEQIEHTKKTRLESQNSYLLDEIRSEH